MTIDAGWVKILKTNAPRAFTDTMPASADIVFIDGQIKLMKGDYVTTWDAFVQCQFINTIENAFALGAPVVVMGFDDYTYVPRSKNMTQSKRNRSVPDVVFLDSDELPPRPPEEWMASMRNRTFKVKVIKFVLLRLKQHFRLEDRRSVVLDFHGVPEVVCGSYKLPALFAAHSHETPLRRGECDIKGPDYLPLRGNLLLDSTDGDFIPIALIQLERQRQQGPSSANIFVRRIKVRTTTKRAASGASKREFEFVNIDTLLAYLKESFPRANTPAASFGVMAAITGCDFCMNLPALGPSKIWAARTKLRDNPLSECADIISALVVVYQQLLQNKCKGVGPESIRCITDTRSAKDVYEQQFKSAQRCLALAPRTKSALWAADRLVAHACNVLWTLQYWTLLHAAPDPLSGNFGYAVVKNLVCFEACAKVTVAPKARAKLPTGPV
jgi:alkylhydroperoxidase family enzyme